MSAAIDLKTLQLLVGLMKPAPIAPIAPLISSAYDAGSEGAFGMAKDIQYLRETVNEIKAKLEKFTESYVTNVEFAEHSKDSLSRRDGMEKILLDHETRIRTHTLTIEQMKTQLKVGWGAVLFALSAATLIIHYWH